MRIALRQDFGALHRDVRGENLMFQIVFWSALLIVIICIYSKQRNEIKFTKNIVIGVTLPYEAHEHPKVKQILKDFKKKLDILCAILALLSIAGMLLPELSISMVCWSILLSAMLTLPSILFARTNKKLKLLKYEMGWKSATNSQIELKLSPIIAYTKPSFLAYIPPMLICLCLIFIQPKFWIAHISSLLIVLVCFISATFLYQKRSAIIDEDAELAKKLSCIRYKIWRYFWVLLAYESVIASISIYMTTFSAKISIWLFTATTILFSIILIALELKSRKLQEKFTDKCEKAQYSDDDDYWLGGILYYNPNDSHIIINNRVGTGSTLNLATKTGKIFFIINILIFISVIILIISVGIADRSAINLYLRNSTLYCENGATSYTISLDEIDEIELIKSMPKNLIRTNAIGGQHLLKGSFTGSGMSDLKIIADPTQTPYLKIKTKANRYYILGARNPKIVENLFTDLAALYMSNR